MAEEVRKRGLGKEKISVVLDSNYTDEHVFEELKAYASLFALNSSVVVFDTFVENLPENYLPDLMFSWGIGDNPMTAVKRFLEMNNNFEADKQIENEILVSVAQDGYLKG